MLAALQHQHLVIAAERRPPGSVSNSVWPPTEQDIAAALQKVHEVTAVIMGLVG